MVLSFSTTVTDNGTEKETKNCETDRVGGGLKREKRTALTKLCTQCIVIMRSSFSFRVINLRVEMRRNGAKKILNECCILYNFFHAQEKNICSKMQGNIKFCFIFVQTTFTRKKGFHRGNNYRWKKSPKYTSEVGFL